MMIHDVVRRPHPLVRRHGHQEFAAGLQLSRNRHEGGAVVFNVLNDVERGDQIVSAVRHAHQLRKRCAKHLPSEARFGDCARLIVQLDCID